MSSESEHLELSLSIGSASFSAGGPKEIVLELYREFKDSLSREMDPGGSQKHPVKEDLPGRQQKKSNSASGQEVKSPTSLPLKPYVGKLNLPGNKERATAIIAWSAESGKDAALNIAEIKTLWKKAPFKMPKNLPRDIAKAETEGWLEREGKAGSPEARYSITGYGEGIVASWTKSTD